MKKIILSLYSGTGSWEKPYKDAGYEVIPVTLPETDVITYIPPEDVYGVLAAPPCTMFSKARTNAKTPRDIKAGLSTVDAIFRIIWLCKPKFWAIENPDGLLKNYLGAPQYTFQPYEFGDRYSKKTCLWGNFNLPKKNPITLTKQEKLWAKTNSRPIITKGTGLTVATIRAITPPGFAKAFMEANK